MTAHIIDLGDRNADADLSRYAVYAGPEYTERAGRATFAARGQLWEREAERADRAEMARIDAAFQRIDAEMTHYEGELTRVRGELDELFTDLDRAMQAATQPFYPADQSLPEGWPPAPHVHEHVVVADFGGIRASIAECKSCGDTRTFWRSAVIGEVIG